MYQYFTKATFLIRIRNSLFSINVLIYISFLFLSESDSESFITVLFSAIFKSHRYAFVNDLNIYMNLKMKTSKTGGVILMQLLLTPLSLSHASSSLKIFLKIFSPYES